MLVDDHELIRQGLRRAFERDSEFQVVGEAASVADARRLADTTQPDVAVLDVRLPDGSGLDLAQALRAARPDVGLVILTMYAGDDQLFAALDAGASAFVPKSAPSDDVVAAARHAAAKPSSFIAADLAEAMHRKLNPSGPQLTRREREVLGLLAEGLGVSSISRKLYISESTTKTHVSKLYDKLGAGNRAQAIMAAVRAGLLDSTTEP
ncbi:response regulator transcription factor [Phytoactinopolyspora halotolerans]|uniref:Response regulator transcription factor n=1 Tax=Phytoactinopolyspora halotolerans TaxID=1981512 RepID=A0A6L9S999_9ACTN|nr:response regulator transcription factor [Phytoactinopolyspora halotolerans]